VEPSRLSAAAVQPLPGLVGDPASVDLAPLRWLDALVDGARVVAVGESAHFNAESYRFRHLLLRYLVERHGFTAYAMESGFAEAHMVDAWLDSPAGSAAAADIGTVLARGTTSLMGMCVEHRQLLEWLRTADVGGVRPRFYGVDTPGSNVSLLPALDLVAAYLAQTDPGLRIEPSLRELAAETSASSVFAAQDAFAAYAALPLDQKDALTAGLSLLLARLRARHPEHRAVADASARPVGPVTTPALDYVVRALESAIALDAYRRDMTVNVRDLAQADTVEWILRREERIVLAAHNGHVQRWPVEFPGVLPRTTTAGQHLAARLGPQYRVIGVTNGSGQTLATGSGFFEGQFFDELPPPPPGTLDAVMAARHDVPFGVDLHRLTERDRAVLATVGEQCSGGFVCPINPLIAYDALVHLPHVTPARPDTDAVDAAPTEVVTAFRRWLDTT
jgi:erythromycin esterase